MNVIEATEKQIEEGINWEAAKSTSGATWTYNNKKLNVEVNTYKGLKNDQDRQAYILQNLKDNKIK